MTATLQESQQVGNSETHQGDSNSVRMVVTRQRSGSKSMGAKSVARSAGTQQQRASPSTLAKEKRKRKCSVCKRTSPESIFSCRYKVNEKNISFMAAFFEKELEYGELCDRCYRCYYKHKKAKEGNNNSSSRSRQDGRGRNAKKRKLSRAERPATVSKTATVTVNSVKSSTAKEERKNGDDSTTVKTEKDVLPRTRSNTKDSAASASSAAAVAPTSNSSMSSSSPPHIAAGYYGMSYPYYGYTGLHQYPIGVGALDPAFSHSNSALANGHPQAPSGVGHQPYYYGSGLYHYPSPTMDSTPFHQYPWPVYGNKPNSSAPASSSALSVTDAASVLLSAPNSARWNGRHQFASLQQFQRPLSRLYRSGLSHRPAPAKIIKKRLREEEARQLRELELRRHQENLARFRMASKPKRASRRKGLPRHSPAQTDGTHEWLHSTSQFVFSHRFPSPLLVQQKSPLVLDVNKSAGAIAVSEKTVSDSESSMDDVDHLHPEFRLDHQKAPIPRSQSMISTESGASFQSSSSEFAMESGDMSDRNIDINIVSTPAHEPDTPKDDSLSSCSFGIDGTVKSPKMKGSTPTLEAIGTS